MKAIYLNRLYHVTGEGPTYLELIDSANRVVVVDFGDINLIIDPTDTEIEELVE